MDDEQAYPPQADLLASFPEHAERTDVLDLLRQSLGKAEATEHLLDYIQELWETLDLLSSAFGAEGAYTIVHAPRRFFSAVITPHE